jgi:FlaA1/EpsC-like NDP-sugar epimerase
MVALGRGGAVRQRPVLKRRDGIDGEIMMRLARLTGRQWLIVIHDLLVTAAALIATLYLRFEDVRLAARLDWLPALLVDFVLFAAVVFFLFRLHESKWRFTSLPELLRIIQASLVLAISLLVLDYVLLSPKFYGTFFFGKVTIVLYFVIQTTFLSATRIAYRYFREARTQRRARDADAIATLILGRAADVEVPLRAIESGALSNIWPVGLLSPARSDWGASVRGVPVMGGFDDLDSVVALLRKRKTPVMRLVLTASAFEPGSGVESAVLHARRLGLITSRLPSLDEPGRTPQLTPVAVEDLLLRPSVKIDYGRLQTFLAGKSVVVTGGGGSIGSEICDRAVTFGAARLLLVENSELALYAALERLVAKGTQTQIDGRIADVRDRERMFSLLKEFKPDIVFHAAALKHVPLLEQDWGEGIKTNVFGSVNVADAAVAAGAAAMVMISTDKAIEPVSVLGATKRFAEMYCQALDAEAGRRGSRDHAGTRFIAVRFGNVLASNGSVVPKFKAQIEAGGPVTVTHPDMVRYFMTIREACDLVVTAASHALGPERSDVSVYVLKMGQPVKISDLAERMIRLSGLEPGRDVKIIYTGIRPGERLNEILFAREEADSGIGISGVLAARPVSPSLEVMRAWLATLEQGLAREERAAIYAVLHDAVPDFRGVAA